MDDFISKPFVEESIRAVISKFTTVSKNEDEKENPVQINADNDEHFDVAKLKSTYLDDQEFISEFLALTRDSLNKSLADLKKHFESQDLVAIKSTGHRLKGAAASAFLTVVTVITQELEYLETFDPKHVKELITKLEVEIELLLPIIMSVEKV